nr:putative ribonuclease H-like domain-containing protein [Tanacetum cinerariifolium]
MNYHPVIAENQTNSNAGLQDTKKAREEGTQTYVLFPVLSDGSTNSQNNNKDALIDGKEHDDDRFRDLNAEFEECNNNSSNGVNAASSLVSTAGQNSINSTNDFSAAGPSNATMPDLEDLSHSNDADDVGAEADINNLESIISRAIGTKWVYTNKKDKRGIVIRNKARLVTQGHTQEEGIDYEEVFAPVARIEAIRLFLAYASFMGFPVYQMDVKSALLYGTIEEEVYVCQPPRFEDPKNPDKVYKVVKALYGLHQAPRAWYETLATYLLENGFQRETIDQNLFIKKQQKDILLVQIYVDDIIFVKRVFRYLKGKPYLGLWYPKASPFDLVAYSDSDYAGASLDRKSTTGGCEFLGCRLISWQCKKQTIVATSSTEAEYVAAASGCAQVLWIQNQLLDYGVFNSPMLHLLRVEMVINSPWMLSKNWLVQKQTAFGKDNSNPFMANNLPKIVWFSTHHVTFMKSWLGQKQTALGQTATGKENSNPFMAGSLSKTIMLSFLQRLCFHMSPFEFTFVYLVVTSMQMLNRGIDSPLLGVNTPRSDEDRLKLT